MKISQPAAAGLAAMAARARQQFFVFAGGRGVTWHLGPRALKSICLGRGGFRVFGSSHLSLDLTCKHSNNCSNQA